jgi:hypothetical protein
MRHVGTTTVSVYSKNLINWNNVIKTNIDIWISAHDTFLEYIIVRENMNGQSRETGNIGHKTKDEDKNEN